MTDRSSASENRFATFLRDRRNKLDPAALGFPSTRRRTKGLRREEVAQRAHISPTWYTWLEQGRGGAPSADVLDRIARALILTAAEREHLFLLGLGRLPDVQYRSEDAVTPRLQRVLDALEPCPAVIRTALWDVVAWNRAASQMFGDYEATPTGRRNILKFIFLDPRAKDKQSGWEGVARFAVGAFRVGAARAGAQAEAEALVEELSQLSPEFRALWRENDVPGPLGEAVKRMRHPKLGTVDFETSAFAVDGRTDLTMIVYNPASAADADRLRSALT